MGYLLKEALKTLCGVNQWSYAVFWKIGCQNPNLLIWEDCYYEPPMPCSSLMGSGNGSSKLALEEWEGCWVTDEPPTQVGVRAKDNVPSLINSMMLDNRVQVVGQGLVGRAAFTGNHLWIHSENYPRQTQPPEVQNEVHQQFSAGIRTVVVIPVLTHGVVQLGSSLEIMENTQLVNDVKSLILELGCVPSALLSDYYSSKESAPRIGVPVFPKRSVSADPSGNFKVEDFVPLVAHSCNQQSITSQAFELVGQPSHAITRDAQNNLQGTSSFQAPRLAPNVVKSQEDKCLPSLPNINPVMKSGFPFSSQLDNEETEAEIILLKPELWLNQHAAFHNHRSGFGEEYCARPTLANYRNLRIMDDQILSGVNMSCKHLAGSSVNGGSSETEISTLDMMDHLPSNHLLLGSSDSRCHSKKDNCVQLAVAQRREGTENDPFPALNIPLGGLDEPANLSENITCFEHDSYRHDYGNQSPRLEFLKIENECVQPSSRDDLFDILGMDIKNKLFNGSSNNLLISGRDTNPKTLNKNNFASLDLHDADSELYSGSFCAAGADDHLLDAIVSRVHTAAKQSSDDSVSCRTTLTKSSSSVPFVSPSCGRINVSDQMQGELSRLPKSMENLKAIGSCSFKSECSKKDAGKYSGASSICGSQISSWVQQDQSMKYNSSASTAYSKMPDEVSKSNRKRLKPGENPRPRPKDRQMIQDRMKELREIVPNGAKCSIDALLERTIKHMLFLQSVTKHADKLKQAGESKIINMDGGVLLKDNFEGGRTWAYEVDSQSMVCPIIVEDLNLPRQMLVEMLCEERGLFLEIADLIRGLGLTILKGVMETRNDKIWARFTVEANRDVTRMEIFVSLVHLLEQTVKSSAASGNSIENDNRMIHQSLHPAPSISASGGPCGLLGATGF